MEGGLWIFVSYALLMVVSGLYLRFERVQPFARRFALSFGAFMVASLILYFVIAFLLARTFSHISLLGHAWRIAFVAAVGAIVSLAVAQLTSTRDQSTTTLHTSP